MVYVSKYIIINFCMYKFYAALVFCHYTAAINVCTVQILGFSIKGVLRGMKQYFYLINVHCDKLELK